MRHYFIDRERSKDEYFSYKQTFNNKSYFFHSAADVFSKNQIDDGTATLLNAVIDNFELQGNVLDLGCGIGVIGIVLKREFNKINVTMSDINKTALSLTKKNITENQLNISQFEVLESNLYETLGHKKYDYIITNPPIKTGKQTLLGVIDGAYDNLSDNGQIVLVIRKDHGADSLKKHMTQVFGNCQVLKRNKGYYILNSIKQV